MKKILSLILSSALVLGLFNVPELNIYAEEPKPDVQPWDNRYGPLPEGKFVMENQHFKDNHSKFAQKITILFIEYVRLTQKFFCDI